LAGAIAGVSEILVMYPLDGKHKKKKEMEIFIENDLLVVKTRAQLSTGVSTGIIDTIKNMIKNEG
jgi:hypothetical protein